ncbi:hypothetical protein Vretimale_1456 [Volvox reticuliferus]|uniref:ABC transporter domain-containing protein n=1 Tax=Volvox reticuliferus TaxID=1737510 RepID=A0A8J4D985_9CHLO|nr:hypothetical protein Vretimale_1456 [Volvox reticuliferus]
MNLSAAWLLLMLTCTPLVRASASPKYRNELQLLKRRQLASTCARNEQCDANQFCLVPGRSGSTGVCASCWRCCLFPDVYGDCPAVCNCNSGATCGNSADCGQGLFCSIEDPWQVPVCQPCNNCTSDQFEIGGSCALACPSADMSALNLLPHLRARHFLFLAFLAHDISQQGADAQGVLLKAELLRWVKGQGLEEGQAETAVVQMMAGATESVDMKSWMELVSESSSLSYICPSYDADLPWNMQPMRSAPGCFCNATADARTFRCPAGQRCSRDAFLGLETDAPRDPTAQIFRALCVACEQGQYCPEGTFLKDEAQLGSLECPDGFYCPTPAVLMDCPAGFYCASRTTKPITCDMEHLLLTDPNQELPMQPDTVIVRIRDRRDPIRGNFCPAKSTKPNELCSAGSFCPNASTIIKCPKGYYCKAQSTSPSKCPLLTRCPPGTTVPPLSFMALVIAAIVVSTIPLLQLAFTHLDNSVIMDADEDSDKRALHRAAVASRMTFRLLKSIKVNQQSALENKYRGFGTVSPPITMEFESLGLRIRPRGGEVKNVLMGVSGSFAPRRLNAILGPSGCGKTTFLNVLCGKISNGTLMGQVRINGEDIPIDKLKKIMGFVPQDDIVHEDLTVRENLNYSSRLRLPSDMTSNRRRDIVHDALEMLGLSAIQHYRVGTVERRGISGGQRKRVNIGLELVAMPSLLFLDEPTSGLDATSSADILDSLVDMANLGMNIIMVIHQPRFSSFLMFDQVLLLGGGGHTVYLGSPSAAMLYFTKYLGFEFPERENPSDILIDIIAGKVPCAGDPRLKSCAQLVEKWTTGGMAWVETLETLNPMMVTKMCEVDPRIILAIDDEFDRLDPEGTGQINAVQLVSLFLALGQEITLDDAVILIRKINARMPASAKSAARSRGGSSTGVRTSGPSTDGTSLTVTKQQLLNAFQNVREANDEGNTDGAVQRNAAAKFYASHFLLPDLPEVKPYRDKMEHRHRRHAHRQNSLNGDIRCSNSGYDSNNSRPDSPSYGYGGGFCPDHLDSDSYSTVGQDPDDKYYATPVVESIMRRSILAPSAAAASVSVAGSIPLPRRRSSCSRWDDARTTKSRMSRGSGYARSARLSGAEDEEDYYEEEEEDGGEEHLPPLLRQLVSHCSAGALQPANIEIAGPVAEGLEEGTDAAALTCNGLGQTQTQTQDQSQFQADAAAVAAPPPPPPPMDRPSRPAVVRKVAASALSEQSAPGSPPPPPPPPPPSSAPRPQRQQPSVSEGGASRERSSQPPAVEQLELLQYQRRLPAHPRAHVLPQGETRGLDLVPEQVPRLNSKLDPDLDPEHERISAPARYWQHHNPQAQKIKTRSVMVMPIAGDSSEAGLNDLPPDTLPLGTSPQASASAGVLARQWRRFGTSLPHGSVGLGYVGHPTAPGGDVNTATVTSGGYVDRTSRSSHTRASRFAARHATVSGEITGGGRSSGGGGGGGGGGRGSGGGGGGGGGGGSGGGSAIVADAEQLQQQQQQQQQQQEQQLDGVDGEEGPEPNTGDADEAEAAAAAAAVSDGEACISGKSVPDGGATDGVGGDDNDGDGRRTPKYERGSNMDPKFRVRLHELRNNSAPLPEFTAMRIAIAGGGSPQVGGRQRRLSFGPVNVMSPGRKQRRHSWLQVRVHACVKMMCEYDSTQICWGL